MAAWLEGPDAATGTVQQGQPPRQQVMQRVSSWKEVARQTPNCAAGCPGGAASLLAALASNASPQPNNWLSAAAAIEQK
jgi:hypothetical protein